MRHPTLAFIAVALGLIGLGALGYFVISRPTVLRIAVGPVGSENVRVVSAAIQTFQREREAFRLRMVLTEGSTHSARLLDENKVDLAVLRPDIAIPRSAGTVAVMHVDHLLFAAPGNNGVKEISDLKGKAVAIFRDNVGNPRILQTVAAQAGLSAGDFRIETVRITELKSAFESGRIHAVFVIAPISTRTHFDVVTILGDTGGGEVSFLPIVDAKAIEQRFPLLEADTLLRGLFGGQVPRPAEDIPTLTVSHLLLASRAQSDATVADFTRAFINAKTHMAVEAPLAARIEAPDQEKDSPIPIHPGTVTYLDGQVSTFLERYGDWFYIGLMALGIGGSGIAGYFSYAAARARRSTMHMLATLQGLITEARTVADPERLSSIRAEADVIFNQTIAEAIDNNLDPSGTLAFHMAFAQVHEAIQDRQRALSGS